MSKGAGARRVAPAPGCSAYGPDAAGCVMTSDKNGERGGRLQLKAVLDKRSADGLSADLMAMRGQDLYVDASSVNVLSGPCLQVLLAAVSDWAAEDRVLAFDDPSDAFIKALQQFGVAQSRSEP